MHRTGKKETKTPRWHANTAPTKTMKIKKRPGKHTMRPRQLKDEKKNRRGLENAGQGPDDTKRNKKDARLDDAPTEQRQGPDDRTNGGVSTGRQITSVTSEDDNVGQRN